MTTPAELNAARLTQQLEINRQKLAVKSLQQQARTGARWSNITDEWNKSDESVKLTRKTLQNLNGQNEGLKNQPGYVTTKSKITQNIVETNVLSSELGEVRTTTQKNENSFEVTNNLPRNSAGSIVKNASIASVEDGRFTTPIAGNNFFFDDVEQEVKPVIDSLNKPSNATQSNLRVFEDQQLGDNKGSGSTSTVGGATPVVKLSQTQNRGVIGPNGGPTIVQSGGAGGAGGGSLARATDDDATTVTSNSVGTASQVVEGRVAVAAEFMKPIVAKPNKLAALASQTYSISIYIMNMDEYKQLLATDKKTLPTDQLIIQSGGAPVGQRNEFFDLDFYVEDLEIRCAIGTQETQSPHNVQTMKFNILEPQGITFLSRLSQACAAHENIENVNVNSQTFLMVIRFYGYDDQGNLISSDPASGDEQTSDPNALVEKFVPFQFSNITYQIKTEAVVYSVEATVPQTTVGYSTARGTIPFNFQLSAADVQTLFNGNTQLVDIQRQQVDTDDDEALEVAERTPPAKKVGLTDRTVTQGLATALNQHQRDIVEKKGYLIADEYVIELEDVAGLKDAKMKKQGTVDKKRTAFEKSSDPNQKLNQNKQALDVNSREYSITAGTQITQLIDQVMKNSTYITAQQTVAFDEVTGKRIENPPVKTVQWYKITQTATPIGYDRKRNDFAYKIKYFISRYQINTPRSPYFPPAMYRGAHKIFNYWFTGQNTEVIDFQIDVNSNYLQSIGKDGLNDESTTVVGDARFAEKKFFETAPNSSMQGGEGESTRPAAELASRLYDPADVAKSEITIVGDPDFITQSEIFYNNVTLGSFEADGSVNSNASEVLYEIRFNRVVDYDYATGLTPVFKENLSKSGITGETNIAQESIVFTGVEIFNYFKNGQFTQKLHGAIRTFDTAVDSPEQKKAQSNVVEEQPGLDAFGGAGETVRPTKKPAAPVGSRGSGEFLDPRGRKQAAPTGVNQVPDYISGSTRSSGPTPVNNTASKTVPYTSATVNNATTRRIAESGINGDVDYTGSTIDTDTDNWQPPVQPKPGSNTISDDAGTNSGFRGSLLKKKTQRSLERSNRRVKAGAKVVGGGGAGTNSSAFR